MKMPLDQFRLSRGVAHTKHEIQQHEEAIRRMQRDIAVRKAKIVLLQDKLKRIAE